MAERWVVAWDKLTSDNFNKDWISDMLKGINAQGEEEDLLNYEIIQLRVKVAALQDTVEALKEDNRQLTELYYKAVKDMLS